MMPMMHWAYVGQLKLGISISNEIKKQQINKAYGRKGTRTTVNCQDTINLYSLFTYFIYLLANFPNITAAHIPVWKVMIQQICEF